MSSAEQRAVRTGEAVGVARVGDLYASLTTITGKLELEYEGELHGAQRVAGELIRTALSKVYSRYLGEVNLQPVVQWFELGGELRIPMTFPSADALREMQKIEGLLTHTERLGVKPKALPASVLAAGEFILEGLWAHRRISRNEERGFFAETRKPQEPREAAQRPPRKQFN